MENREQELQLEVMGRRLERLERRNRCWRGFGVLALVLLDLIFLLGASTRDASPVAQEIQARAFVLVDRAGTPLARLGLLPQGAWGLGFYDQGKKVAWC